MFEQLETWMVQVRKGNFENFPFVICPIEIIQQIQIDLELSGINNNLPETTWLHRCCTDLEHYLVVT